MDDFILLLFFTGGIVIILAWFTISIYQSIQRKGIFGINLRRVNCPKCEAEVARIRTPNNFRQAMFGGGNCFLCGCEMDKWGNQISNPLGFKDSQGRLGKAHEEFIKLFDGKGKTPIEKVFEEK